MVYLGFALNRFLAVPPGWTVLIVIGFAAIIAATTFALIAMLTFIGIFMLQDSLDLDPQTLTRSGEPLLPRLRDMQFFLGLLVVVLTLTTGIFSTVLGRMGERQRGLSRRESLTGCFNRRAFYELFPREAERARRLGQGLSLVFLDIDHFKRINDRFGHEFGDRVLQQLGARLQGTVRETDLLFRWGGEEFAMMLEEPLILRLLRVKLREELFKGLVMLDMNKLSGMIMAKFFLIIWVLIFYPVPRMFPK